MILIMIRKTIFIFSFLTAIFVLLIFCELGLTESNATGDFTVHVWLADVEVDTGMTQVCVDVTETYASICRNVNANATENASQVGEAASSLAVDAGFYSIPRSEVPPNGTVAVCVYVFKYKNGDCEEVVNTSEYKPREVLLRINYSPVFFDEEDGRLYRYGQNYRSESGMIFAYEHESVRIPSSSSPRND
jgi:hypothetical protein